MAAGARMSSSIGGNSGFVNGQKAERVLSHCNVWEKEDA